MLNRLTGAGYRPTTWPASQSIPLEESPKLSAPAVDSVSFAQRAKRAHTNTEPSPLVTELMRCFGYSTVWPVIPIPKQFIEDLMQALALPYETLFHSNNAERVKTPFSPYLVSPLFALTAYLHKDAKVPDPVLAILWEAFPTLTTLLRHNNRQELDRELTKAMLEVSGKLKQLEPNPQHGTRFAAERCLAHLKKLLAPKTRTSFY